MKRNQVSRKAVEKKIRRYIWFRFINSDFFPGREKFHLGPKFLIEGRATRSGPRQKIGIGNENLGGDFQLHNVLKWEKKSSQSSML